MNFETLGYRIDCRLDNLRWHIKRWLGWKPPQGTGEPLMLREVTQEALKLLRTHNAFLESVCVNIPHSGQPASIGPSLRIRLPEDYQVRQ